MVLQLDHDVKTRSDLIILERFCIKNVGIGSRDTIVTAPFV